MPIQKIDNFIKKAALRLELKTGKLGITPFFIGNHTEDLFFDHFDASEYLDTLGVGQERISIDRADTLFIVGTLNLNQQALLTTFLAEKPTHFDLVLHIRGPLIKTEVNRSCFVSSNLGELLEIDITYDRFPIVPKEIFSKIREFQMKRIS